ncbi:M48 family metalloprotease [Novosphingobium sp. 1949]|uniref:Protease HtpX homolog n=1 Tax=Novosphingobium organovorum TaxID=2930092 RepID=A0ABT0BFC8_9SPHN|nr:M48 family metalloprotease [Novosphingobium organovorum]MCJ2183777.1 M48 family metalloprotease [Novosphingobium organovorum]
MNGLKTVLLLAALSALLMSLGYLFGGLGGAGIALLVAAAMNLFTFWNADSIVLRLHNAREVDAQSAPQFHALVAALAARAGLPMPRLYLIDTEAPNAFATGRNPEHAALAATTGLLRMLTSEEIGAVMAHELGHVRHRDTLTMTMVATIAGAISMLANFGLFFGGRSDQRSHPLAAILAVFMAPFAAMIVQMAISRTREYSADKASAEICGNPRALASALAKIAGPATQLRNPAVERNPASAQLYIVPSGVSDLFATHPPTEKRIAALLAMDENAAPERPTRAPVTSVPRTAQGRQARSALDPYRKS